MIALWLEVLVIGVAGVFDIRKRQIPLLTFPLLILFEVLIMLFKNSTVSIANPKEVIFYSIIVLIICIGAYFFSDFGGADLLAFLSLVPAFGSMSIWVILGALVLCLPYTISMKIHDNEHSYPFIPYLFASATFFAVWRTVLFLNEKG